MQTVLKRCCKHTLSSSPAKVFPTPILCVSTLFQSTARPFPQPSYSTLNSSTSQTRLRPAKPVTMAPHRAYGTHHQAANATKRVLVPVGHGSEEIEAVVIIDVLRRAGAEVVVASVEDTLQVTCSRGIKLVADELITTAAQHEYDLIALPGGMPGAERLRDSAPLNTLIHSQRSAGKDYAAICATPVVFLESKGLIGDGVKATAHPAFSAKLKNQSVVEQRVVEDGQLITSRGPGTSLEFALSLVKRLFGEEKAKQVAAPMVMHTY